MSYFPQWVLVVKGNLGYINVNKNYFYCFYSWTGGSVTELR